MQPELRTCERIAGRRGRRPSQHENTKDIPEFGRVRGLADRRDSISSHVLKAGAPESKPTRFPIYLSALLFPGAGQFYQRRWIAGLLFAATFLVLMASVLVQTVRFIVANINAATAFMEGRPNQPFGTLSIAGILATTAAAILVYGVSLVDTCLAYFRQCRRMAEEKLDRRMQTLAGAGPLAVLALLLAAGQAFGSDIHLAVRSNNMTRVESIIETEGTGVVCSVVGDGVTPLHLAAALNFEPMAAVLLSWGAKVDQPTSGGFTPLHWAASRNSAAVAKLLISRGASVNAATPDGIAPLHWAASHNATHVIGILLAAGADPGARTKAGLTPLHWAVMKEADGAAMALASNAVYSASGTETNDNGYLVAMAEMASDAQRANMVDADAAAKAPEAPANAPAGHGRAVPGAALYIPLGQGETLPFLWMKALGIWAGEYEVTNGQFRRFRSQHTSLFRDDFNLNGRNQPCVYVSWVDAQSFCDWLNRNFGNRLPAAWKFRLPSDREWVALARCGDSREYPWGNQWPPNYGNYSDRTAKRHFADWKGLPDYDDGHIVTCPVTESGTNEWGLYGMGGNVWEWCDDWYDPSRKYKVRHGGSWEFDGQPALRVEARGFDRPTGRYACVGFRVVAAPSARIMN